MDLLHEGHIDKQTEDLLRNNKRIISKTDDLDDLHGSTFYADLSELNKLSDRMFIRKLAEEAQKSSEYTRRIIAIPVDILGVDKDSATAKLMRFIKSSPKRFKEDFSGIYFMFVNTDSGYSFGLIVDDYKPSEFSTLSNLVTRLEATSRAKALTGDRNTTKKTPTREVVDKKKAKEEKINADKQKLVKAVAKATEDLEIEDQQEAIDAIDSDEDVIAILQQLEDEEKPQINRTRAARMTKVQKEFLDSSVGGVTVKSLIFDTNEEIKPAHLKVGSVNKQEWDQVRFTNFNKSYSLSKDIMSILYSLNDENKTYPVAIRKVDVEDTSTSMDYVITYTVDCEDSFGKRFKLKFDIPKFINNRFMMLRGNQKTMSGQLMLLPCSKSDEDTVQLVSNYNKIFVYRYGQLGKSYPTTDRLIKSLNKYKGKKIKIVPGDNSLICKKYDLPVDYIDLASNYSLIETADKKYYFDQDVYYKKYGADINRGIPYAVSKDDKIIYYYEENTPGVLSLVIANDLKIADKDFDDLFESTKAANRLNYSQASILSNRVPMIVLLGYYEGLTKALKRAKVKYKIDKHLRVTDDFAVIHFADADLGYEVTYESSMLMNGLSECDTRAYTIAEMDKKATWLDFLDNFGGRILSDGLENFKDLFMDPITVEVCKDCKLPIEYLDLLVYANNLLADNKYIKHTDISGNRYRNNEIVAAYFYMALAKSYEQYANSIRRGRKDAMSMKQSAVIDMILTSNISSDLSTLNPLLELTSASTVTFKGPSGMNSDRAYGLDKRTYDESMINKLALSTGFAANVGIDRQVTVDMDLDGTRGYIKDTNIDDMSNTKTFSISEAVTPYGTTRDDPFRSAMTYIQTSKHSMRTKASAPLLITNGADEAMVQMVSDTYAVKAEEDGEVIELTKDYIIIKYKRPVVDMSDPTANASEYRNIYLKETVRKNSDGGFYVTIKLDTSLKKGSKFKKDDILAYDKYSFGKVSEDDALAYNLGALAKVAIMSNDEGFEDSTSISHWMSEALASEIVFMKDTPPLSKSTNIYNMVKVGDYVQEGEPLIIYQNAFDEEDANALLKSITDEDLVSDLGRIRLKAKYTGTVQDIKIYRTCEISEMSDTMAKIVRDYEKQIKATKAMYKKYNIPGANMLDPDYVMPQTGKLKNCQDGIIIEFYIKYNDKLGVGDKLVAQSANKGVVKDIFPEGMEPFTKAEPDEKIHALFAARSFNARMVTSPFISGAINKAMIELDKQVKDILGLKRISVEEANEHR